MPDRETLWAVYTNTDLTEGRGRQYVMHFCRLRSTAIRLGRKGYVQGCDCPVEPVEVLLLDGKRVLPASLIEVKEPTREDEAAEEKRLALEAALSRAKEAGLSAEDIALLRGRAS